MPSSSTSLKIRSSANTPDVADKLALDYFGQVPVAGEAAIPFLVQRIETPNNETEWRVYKPVAVTAKCLICHGNPADQSPALRGKLKAIFPEDQALGLQNRRMAWRDPRHRGGSADLDSVS